MTNPLPVPVQTRTDALIRAARTFVQGLIATVLAAVVPVVMAATGSIQWTSGWWIGIASLVGTTALTAVVSYVSRFTNPPKTS
jgi:hypothetical protein